MAWVKYEIHICIYESLNNIQVSIYIHICMREARPLGQPLEPRTPANVLHLCTWNMCISIYLYWNKVKKRKICMADRSQPRTTALSRNGLSQIWNIYMYICVIDKYISIYVYTYLYAWSTAVGTAPRTENTCKRTTFVSIKYIYKYLSILKHKYSIRRIAPQHGKGNRVNTHAK